MERVTMYLDLSLVQHDPAMSRPPEVRLDAVGSLKITGHWQLTPETAALVERFVASLTELRAKPGKEWWE